MIFVFYFSYWNEMNKLELAMGINAANLSRGLLHGSMHSCCPSPPTAPPVLPFPLSDAADAAGGALDLDAVIAC